MNKNKLISVNDICTIHRLETSFMQSVQATGLIEIVTIEEEQYIFEDDLKELESIVRLYNDMDVNLEGVEVIHRLLQRINTMHNEIITLKNRLDFYEEKIES